MYTHVKSKLEELLKIADENTILICGDILAYYKNEDEYHDSTYHWSDFFNEIVSDSDFEANEENMQLFVTLSHN